MIIILEEKVIEIIEIIVVILIMFISSLLFELSSFIDMIIELMS